jgi:predicted nucleic acid-binding protein
MRSVVYDAGVLIAADRSKRQVWAEHRVRLEAGLVPLVPAPVVAQASRSAKQAQLRRLLRGCEVIAFDQAAAHAAGALLGKTRSRDIVDASVAELSIRKQADVVSDDADDIRKLLAAANAKTSILDL